VGPSAQLHKDLLSLVEPGGDGAVLEPAFGLAVAGIVEAQAWPPCLARMGGKAFGLAAGHVGVEAAEPQQPGPPRLAGWLR
jgi:hypothetical protein